MKSNALRSNPLATRFVEPGRIPWFSNDPQHLDHLVDYFTNKLNWRAAIVGPHGSGKSTLLEHFVPRLGNILLKRAAYELRQEPDKPSTVAMAETDRPIVWLKLRGAGPSAKLLKQTISQWCRPYCLLVIDGYEQLSWLSRVKLLLVTARNKVGLLITSHGTTCLPNLIETQVDTGLACSLLDQLLPSDIPNRQQFLDSNRIQKLLAQHRGNLREVFMQLYDELELG